jgi:alcohol dehydrogenase class IV
MTLSEKKYPEFHIPTRVFIQNNSIKQIGAIVSPYASRALIVTTSDDFEKYEKLVTDIAGYLQAASVYSIIYDEIPEKANNEYIDSAVYFAKKTNCDIIIGLGTFQSINCAKAIALLANNFLFCDDIYGYPEVQDPIRLITVPIMPLHGFEITPFFYMADILDYTIKVYYNTVLHPWATIIDPMLSLQVEDDTLISSCFAAAAFAIESVISKKATDFTNTYALKCIDLTFKHLTSLYRDHGNTACRMPLSTASLMGGIAFTGAFLSVSLALSLGLSSFSDVPITKTVGLLIPHIMDENVRDITVIEAAIKAIEAVRKMAIDIDMPQRLSQYEISKTLFSKAAKFAGTYPFIRNTPRPLSQDELETILIASF